MKLTGWTLWTELIKLFAVIHEISFQFYDNDTLSSLKTFASKIQKNVTFQTDYYAQPGDLNMRGNLPK